MKVALAVILGAAASIILVVLRIDCPNAISAQDTLSLIVPSSSSLYSDEECDDPFLPPKLVLILPPRCFCFFGS